MFRNWKKGEMKSEMIEDDKENNWMIDCKTVDNWEGCHI
jgi:hypothetical protein